MTSAKPQAMAGQSEAPDDLIAELAKLMAGEAKEESPSRSAVRIPGGETSETPPEAASAPVRIPGADAQTPAPKEPRPFRFDFELSSDRKPPEPVAATPSRPSATPSVSTGQPTASSQPEPAASSANVETDSIADLIAAELAGSTSTAETPRAEPEAPNTEDVASGDDTFDIAPAFEVGIEEPVEPVEPVVSAPKLADIPPVTPSVPQPDRAARRSSSSLDDIEKLVGPAVRLSPTPAPSPALRSLATPTVPAVDTARPQPRSARTDATPKVDPTIEEAILAAAAATGAAVEYVENDGAFDDRGAAYAAPRRRNRVLGMSRGFAGPLVAVTLLAVAGLGLYWTLGKTGGTSGPAPLIAASTEPVKETPEPTSEEDAAPQSVVFNEISGVDTGADEQIVSRDQADIEDVTETASFDPTQEGLVNRKVRTVTVRPDGTIVSGEEGLAGGTMLPVDRPNVPDVPGADFSTPSMVANAETQPAAQTTVASADNTQPTGAQADAQATAEPQITPVQPGSTVPAVDSAGAPIAGKSAPVPLALPSDYQQLVANLQQRQAAAPQIEATTPAATDTATPAATTTAAAPATSTVAQDQNPAPAYVQLSSQRSEDAARQSAENIARRYGVLFGGQSLEVQRVDLGERGVFYRVRVPANSLETANNICVNVKAAGGDCFTM